MPECLIHVGTVDHSSVTKEAPHSDYTILVFQYDESDGRWSDGSYGSDGTDGANGTDGRAADGYATRRTVPASVPGRPGPGSSARLPRRR